MIPVSTLYDEYIERRKFTEQKKNPVEYIVPPPQEGRNKNLSILWSDARLRGKTMTYVYKQWFQKCFFNTSPHKQISIFQIKLIVTYYLGICDCNV